MVVASTLKEKGISPQQTGVRNMNQVPAIIQRIQLILPGVQKQATRLLQGYGFGCVCFFETNYDRDVTELAIDIVTIPWNT